MTKFEIRNEGEKANAFNAENAEDAEKDGIMGTADGEKAKHSPQRGESDCGMRSAE